MCSPGPRLFGTRRQAVRASTSSVDTPLPPPRKRRRQGRDGVLDDRREGEGVVNGETIHGYPMCVKGRTRSERREQGEMRTLKKYVLVGNAPEEGDSLSLIHLRSSDCCDIDALAK